MNRHTIGLLFGMFVAFATPAQAARLTHVVILVRHADGPPHLYGKRISPSMLNSATAHQQQASKFPTFMRNARHSEHAAFE